MNKRTKLLAVLALGIACILVGGLLVRGLVVGPLRTIDDQIHKYQAKLVSLQQARTAFINTESQVQAAAARAFGTSVVGAQSKMADVLTKRIEQAGLPETQFTRMPVGHRRLFGAQEIGWTLQGQGSFQHVLDLMFLLETDPRLHRIEELSLSPARGKDIVRVRFSYLTLVLESPPAGKLIDPPTAARLDSPARHRYDTITERNFLVPYNPGEQPAPAPAPLTPEQLEKLREQNLTVVSLSSWDGRPEVDLSDAEHKSILTRQPGDKLLDGTVAMIDYRPLPIPGADGLLSYSRLIWRIGNAYWAVEPGQTLAERRRLSREELPPNLKLKFQTTASQ